jgi:hypothetical protein
MAESLETRFEITSWNEKPHREFTDGGKFTRADVTLAGPKDSLASASFEAVMYYRPDGTSSYVTLMHVTGILSGRAGTFVLQGQGTYDGTTARGESFVVPGSGTDELTGITGSGESVSTHSDYPFMPFTLNYVIE